MAYSHISGPYNESLTTDLADHTNNATAMAYCDAVQLAYKHVAVRLVNGAALTLAAVGVVGNLLSTIVLSKQSPRTVYLMLLLVLSVADELISCCTMIYTSANFIVYFHCQSLGITDVAYSLLSFSVFQFHDFVQLFSNWVLIIMTMDRYLAINRPFAGGFSMRRAGVVVFLTAVGCFLVSLPRLLVELNLMSRNDPVHEPLEILVRYFLPLLLLAILNGRLLFYIRHAQREHSELTGRRRDPNRSVTVILVLVVVVFLLCGTTRGIYIVIKTGWPNMSNKVANNFTWILMVINSSINFMIYVLFYKRFRDSLRELILKPCSPPRKRCTDFTSKSRLTSTTSFNNGQIKNLIE